MLGGFSLWEKKTYLSAKKFVTLTNISTNSENTKIKSEIMHSSEE